MGKAGERVFLSWSLPSRGAWIETRILCYYHFFTPSRSPHGERGLKHFCNNGLLQRICRSPHGERGLKLIQIKRYCLNKCRSPHGERGLKPCTIANNSWQRFGRSPHGERGLKHRQRPARPVRSPGRSPHGERGLIAIINREKHSQHSVAED